MPPSLENARVDCDRRRRRVPIAFGNFPGLKRRVPDEQNRFYKFLIGRHHYYDYFSLLHCFTNNESHSKLGGSAVLVVGVHFFLSNRPSH